MVALDYSIVGEQINVSAPNIRVHLPGNRNPSTSLFCLTRWSSRTVLSHLCTHPRSGAVQCKTGGVFCVRWTGAGGGMRRDIRTRRVYVARWQRYIREGPANLQRGSHGALTRFLRGSDGALARLSRGLLPGLSAGTGTGAPVSSKCTRARAPVKARGTGCTLVGRKCEIDTGAAVTASLVGRDAVRFRVGPSLVVLNERC